MIKKPGAIALPLLRDLVGCLGVLCVQHGVELIYHPAGIIITGLALIGAAVAWARMG